MTSRFWSTGNRIGADIVAISTYAGIATPRQEPETASGTIFGGLKDETGTELVIVWRSLRATASRVLR